MLVTALAVALGAVGLVTAPAAVAAPDRLPLTVTNDSGRGEAVYLYVLGTDLASGRLGWVDAAGTFTAWPAGSLPPSPAPDVAIAGPGQGGSTTVHIPRGFSGRVYFSFGEKLPFSLTPDGLVQPAPWVADDPSHDILFDWSELTYDASGLWFNSSQVDMFAVPHEVGVTAPDGTTRTIGALVAGGRDQVIDAMRANPAWANTVVTRDDGTVLRVLAPGKAAAAGLLADGYLDGYISWAWQQYVGRDLTIAPFTDSPGVRFYGRTIGDVMRFTNTSGTVVATFTKPSSADVWGCDGNLFAPNDAVVGPIARTLCAALNRGTLGTLDVQPTSDTNAFYRSSPTNEYAAAVHAAMADGRAYAFAFDDVGGFESLVHEADPSAASIRLGSFTGGSDGGSDDGSDDGGSVDGSTVSIVSDWNGKCVDVPAGNFADGQRIHVWTCDGSANQDWTFVDGTIRTQADMCLDVAWGSTANGAAVQIATCSGNPAQQFVLSDAGDLVNPQANKCVDLADWNPADGAVLQLWECAGTANQKWHLG
ncbi:beta-1,3-glucanase family protein [Actinotalea sp. M2MS4P-6]|nr:beta-1,3-glucanase family protein [Actinotalea sp. M2MS4P-6]